MSIKNILFSVAVSSSMLSSVKAEITPQLVGGAIGGCMIGFGLSQLLNQNNSVETSTNNEATKVTETSTNNEPAKTGETSIDKKESERPRINVTVFHGVDKDVSQLIISGDSFYLNSYRTNDNAPVIIEDSEGNFLVTTAGEFDGLEDVFLTRCYSGYHPEGKYVNAFIVQPLGKGRHFDINNLEICGNPVIIQAIAEFQKARQNRTKN